MVKQIHSTRSVFVESDIQMFPIHRTTGIAGDRRSEDLGEPMPREIVTEKLHHGTNRDVAEFIGLEWTFRMKNIGSQLCYQIRTKNNRMHRSQLGPWPLTLILISIIELVSALLILYFGTVSILSLSSDIKSTRLKHTRFTQLSNWNCVFFLICHANYSLHRKCIWSIRLIFLWRSPSPLWRPSKIMPMQKVLEPFKLA